MPPTHQFDRLTHVVTSRWRYVLSNFYWRPFRKLAPAGVIWQLYNYLHAHSLISWYATVPNKTYDHFYIVLTKCWKVEQSYLPKSLRFRSTMWKVFYRSHVRTEFHSSSLTAFLQIQLLIPKPPFWNQAMLHAVIPSNSKLAGSRKTWNWSWLGILHKVSKMFFFSKPLSTSLSSLLLFLKFGTGLPQNNTVQEQP